MPNNHAMHQIDTDELIIMLENDSTFYHKWLALAEQALPYFFKTMSGSNAPKIHFYWQLNGLSFTAEQIFSARIGDFITVATQQFKLDNAYVAYASNNEANRYFLDKMVNQITSGELTLPSSVLADLSVIYAESKTNIAKACRALNKSRHAVTKLADKYSRDMFNRYQRVQAKERYAKVMGDCFPYVQDQPAFTPVQLVNKEQGEDMHKKLITPGSFVAEWGSMRFHEVSHLGCSGGLVFTTDKNIVHFPCRVLPAQYREVAHKFCSSINGMAAHDFIATSMA